MGIADLVPGVSGGTMALILGIYAELLASIRTLTQRSFWRRVGHRQWRLALYEVNGIFLLFLGLGILSAVFLLSRRIEHFLEYYPLEIWSFFFGLVLASTVLVGRQVKGWNLALASTSVLVTGLTYWLVGQVPIALPSSWWFLFLSGALAVCAMILPGISGSYVLILLGQYHTVLTALNERDVAVLGLVILGALCGILTFARLLSWLFERYPRAVLALLTGFMLGSLRRIWPWQEHQALSRPQGETVTVFSNVWPPLFIEGSLNGEWITALSLSLAGLILVVLLSLLTRRQTSVSSIA